MGQTREKKPSKRSLKLQTASQASGKATAIPLLPAPTTDIVNSTTHSSTTDLSLLTPPQLSAKSSFSSFNPSTSPTTHIPQSTPCTESRTVEGRGTCLFATRTLPKGSLVLAEIPAIRLTAAEEQHVSHDDSHADALLESKFAALNRSAQKHFKRLHDSQKRGFSRVRSIYHTNCYNLAGARSELGGSCVGLRASRINHACVPNVQFSFLENVPAGLGRVVVDSDDGFSGTGDVDVDGDVEGTVGWKRGRGVMLFYALKRIQKGAEILSNYESAYYTAPQRQTRLQLYYGFVCDCHACESGSVVSAFWARSDERRREMISLRREVRLAENKWREEERDRDDATASLRRELSGEQRSGGIGTIEFLKRLAALLELEGLMGTELVDVYHRLVKWIGRAGHGGEDELEKWMEKEREAIIFAYGPWSSRLNQTRR